MSCSLWKCAAAVFMGLLFTACAAPQPAVDQTRRTAEDLRENPPEWLAKWYDYITPGKEHQALSYFEGSWRGEAVVPASSKCSPNCTSVMTLEYEKDLDGLFFVVRSTYKSASCESRGLGAKGFNKSTGEYEWFYAKTTGSGVSFFKGSYDPKARSYTYTAEVPSEQGPVPTRIVERIIDDNTYEFDLYQEYDGEPAHKVHAVFRRKGSS